MKLSLLPVSLNHVKITACLVKEPFPTLGTLELWLQILAMLFLEMCPQALARLEPFSALWTEDLAGARVASPKMVV